MTGMFCKKMNNYILIITYDVDNFHEEIKEKCKDFGFIDEEDCCPLPFSTLLYTTEVASPKDALSSVKDLFQKCVQKVSSEKRRQIEITHILVAVCDCGEVDSKIKIKP